MPITVEAIYEHGVLRPSTPLPFKDGEKVRVVLEPQTRARRTHGIIPCSDAELIERIALDTVLEYEQ